VTRVALIHALALSVVPVNAEFERQWPEAERMNLLDDSLSSDLARSQHGLDAAVHARFVALADYAVGTGAQAILFTCSAFGPCIEAVSRRLAPLPVLKPNEAMVAEAVALGGPIGLVATFAPTLSSMTAEFPRGTDVITAMAAGALDALNRGDGDLHDRLVAQAAHRLVEQGARVIALAQFSMARALGAVEAECGAPVITTVDSAVRLLRRRLGLA